MLILKSLDQKCNCMGYTITTTVTATTPKNRLPPVSYPELQWILLSRRFFSKYSNQAPASSTAHIWKTVFLTGSQSQRRANKPIIGIQPALPVHDQAKVGLKSGLILTNQYSVEILLIQRYTQHTCTIVRRPRSISYPCPLSGFQDATDVKPNPQYQFRDRSRSLCWWVSRLNEREASRRVSQPQNSAECHHRVVLPVLPVTLTSMFSAAKS